MKPYKLKPLLIAACCFVTAMWTEIQGAEEFNNDRERAALPPGMSCSSSFLTGSIMAFSGDENSITHGCGWVLCDGTQVSSLKYPELYAVIGEKYAPEDEKLFLIKRNNAAVLEKIFYLPDLRGRVIVGVDGGTSRVTSNNTLGKSGGEENVTLMIDQMPKYDIKFPLSYNGYSITGTNKSDNGESIINYCGNTLISSNGNDQPHNNMQPYTCLNYIINTGEMNKPAASNQDERINQLEQEIKSLKIVQRGCAKAWVVFDGAANILDSYGVSHVIRDSTGVYTINFSNPFNSANYCSSLNAGYGSVNASCVLISGPYLEDQKRDSFKLHTFLPAGFQATNPSFVSASFYSS